MSDEEFFEYELTKLLNKYNMEPASGTPDFVLAEYLLNCWRNFNKCVQDRSQWRGEEIHRNMAAANAAKTNAN